MNGGIYQIRNKRNRHIYIGYAKDINSRWTSHRSKLNTGKHVNKELQADWIKHGERFFAFEVLQYVNNVPDMRIAETEWINRMQETHYLYNISKRRSIFGKMWEVAERRREQRRKQRQQVTA